MKNTTLLVVGNWKMNGVSEDLVSLSSEISSRFFCSNSNLVLCPPYVYLSLISRIIKGSGVSLGAQNCSFESNGAFTGEISVSMLKDVGCSYVILGHSERRQILCETNKDIMKKAIVSLESSLTPIICVGETLYDYSIGGTFSFLRLQINSSFPDFSKERLIILAYEPIWSIGTGKLLSFEKLSVTYDFLKLCLVEMYGDFGNKFPILYGGSVNPNNIFKFLEIDNLDGFLVGGASLNSKFFLDIARQIF